MPKRVIPTRDRIKEDALALLHRVICSGDSSENIREKAANDALNFINREREIDSVDDVEKMIKTIDRLRELNDKLIAHGRTSYTAKGTEGTSTETPMDGNDTASVATKVH